MHNRLVSTPGGPWMHEPYPWANLKGLSKQYPSFPCPTCESDMRKLKSKDSGFFWGCSTYPECKTTLPDADGKPGEKEAPKDSEYSCPKCNKALRRIKNKKGKYFFGCSGYKEGCKYMVDDNKGKPAETFDCPKCNKNHLVKRKGSKGLFFGCSGYPECRATFENKRGKPDFSKNAA
jgi:ssDNA-binding Zn-finger/Zn-ribbon topoisomerase 1